MAKKTKHERDLEILDYKINKEKQLVKDWKKYDINQKKIDALEAKQAKHEAEKITHEA